MRFPRKKKKEMKKRKAKADALITAQAAIASVQAAIQVAMVAATPLREAVDVLSKTLRLIEVTQSCAQSITRIMKQIKPWQQHSNSL